MALSFSDTCSRLWYLFLFLSSLNVLPFSLFYTELIYAISKFKFATLLLFDTIIVLIIHVMCMVPASWFKYRKMQFQPKVENSTVCVCKYIPELLLSPLLQSTWPASTASFQVQGSYLSTEIAGKKYASSINK